MEQKKISSYKKNHLRCFLIIWIAREDFKKYFLYQQILARTEVNDRYIHVCFSLKGEKIIKSVPWKSLQYIKLISLDETVENIVQN